MNIKTLISSSIALLVLLGAVVAGLILVGQEQDIRDKAASGSDCDHSSDCDLLNEPGNRGSYTADRDIEYVDITARYYHRYHPGESDDCYKVDIKDNHISWERIGDGPDCKDISNIQCWKGDNTPSPSPSPSVEPSPSSEPSPSLDPSPSASPSTPVSPTASPQLGCPLVPNTGQILVDFNSSRISANASEAESQAGPFSVNLPAGVYKVTLASSDDHIVPQQQLKEQYYLDIFAGGQTITSTNSIRDINDNEQVISEIVNENLTINQNVTSVLVKHTHFFNSSSSESLNAECALFERKIIPITARCSEVKIFDIQWGRILSEDFSTLQPGDVIRFTVSGTASEGNIEKARFVINGDTSPEVTQKRPGTSEFFYEYTIPEGMTQLSVKGEVYHNVLGWY